MLLIFFNFCVVFLYFVCLRPVSCMLNTASGSRSEFLIAPSVFSNVCIRVTISALQEIKEKKLEAQQSLYR